MPRHHRIAFLGVMLLFIATAILVPISVTCAVIASESPVTYEQMVRLSRASLRVGSLALVFQVVSAWLVLGKSFTPLRFLGTAAGFFLGSSIGGLLFSEAPWWWRVALFFA